MLTTNEQSSRGKMTKTKFDPWEKSFDPNDPVPDSKLNDFLLFSASSVARESIFTHRFISDMKLGAAKFNYHLQTYEPDVDCDGYDVVLQDTSNTISVQLKTFLNTTEEWDIRKRLLRPEPGIGKYFGYPEDNLFIPELLEQFGFQGAVVLIRPLLDQSGSLDTVEYFYSDIFVLYAMGERLVPQQKAKIETIALAKQALSSGDGSEKISLRKTMFVRAASPECLLALAGLRCRYSSSWRLNLLRYLHPPVELLSEEDQDNRKNIGSQIQQNLQQLTR